MLGTRVSPCFYKFLVLLLVVLPLFATLAAVILLWNRYVFPLDIALLIIGTLLTGLGIGIGFHRMLTHEGFETHPFLKAIFLILGVMGFMGNPSSWAGVHIKHHAHSDQEDDPHSPLDGFWHAHLGWIFLSEDGKEMEKYAPHLLTDPVVRFVDRTTILWMVVSLIIPYLIGGWTGLIWGGGVRIFLNTHITWSVNSICHCFGSRPFETTDESRNNWLIGLLSYGEGWHNNHHAFPRNAFHGMRWWQFDLSGYLIRALEKFGLVWNVQRVSEEAVSAKLQKAAGMRATLSAMRTDLSAKIATAQLELTKFLAQPFRHALSDEQLAELDASCAGALRRMEEIKHTISRASTLRKQRFHAYGEEIQELVARAKEKLPRAIAA